LDDMNLGSAGANGKRSSFADLIRADAILTPEDVEIAKKGFKRVTEIQKRLAQRSLLGATGARSRNRRKNAMGMRKNKATDSDVSESYHDDAEDDDFSSNALNISRSGRTRRTTTNDEIKRDFSSPNEPDRTTGVEVAEDSINNSPRKPTGTRGKTRQQMRMTTRRITKG
jgi:hypothetical protein